MSSAQGGNGDAKPGRVLRAVVPLKAGIAGGGSDLPAYYLRWPGRCLNLGLDLALTVTLHPSRLGEFTFALPGDPDTGLGREMAQRSGLAAYGGLTVSSPAVPGCGLGCSSALAVALAALRHKLNGSTRPSVATSAEPTTDAAALAEEAWRLEAEELGLPVGKQDHYASSFGGVNDLSFRPDGVRVRGLMPNQPGEALVDRCLLVASAGASRRATDILVRQASSCQEGEPAVVRAIADRVRLVPAFARALVRGDLHGLAALMRYDWALKARVDPGIYGQGIEDALARACRAGALAGRLLGAGGSGYLLLVVPAERRDRLCRLLERYHDDVRPVAPARHGVSVTEVTL